MRARGLNPERDLEEQLLLDLIRAGEFGSCLDVGAHSTSGSYARLVAGLVARYDAIDLRDDPQTAALVDHYFIGSVVDLVGAYDLVFSISALEHAGISYPAVDYRAERLAVMAAMWRLTRGELFCTCPFGAGVLIPGQYANVTDADLDAFADVADLRYRFFHRRGHGDAFAEIGRADAAKVEFDPAVGIPLALVVISGSRS